ncbi:MAG TPA: pitrilysin family protein [Terriglobales bacterium]|nr:pitrilysin family protein [Terriglobales bacterium]
MLYRIGFPALAMVFVLTATLASAQAAKNAAGGAAPTSATIAFEKYKLKNGLEVILSEDHRLPMVAVNLWYHVGPSHEKPGRTGFAHLFEHMMFQGSRHIGDDQHFKFLEGAGASDINGTTDFDRTNYFETLPSNQLELALWLESDRMGYLLDTLDQAKLTNQIDVVRNERRQGVENPPYGLVEEAVYQQLFPKGHPYYAYVIGSHADLEAAHLDDVRDFFKQYYAPNNASLAIVGDFDKAQAKALVEKYFGSIPAGPPVEPLNVKTPPITSERRKVVTDRVELPKVYLAWITSPVYKPGDAEFDLAARILGQGKSSRLYKRLVYEDQIAQSVNVTQNSLILGSVFAIEATAKPGVKPEQLEAAITEEVEKLREQGPTAAEIEAARNVIQSTIIRGLETLGGFGGVADRLNQYNHYLGDPGYLPKDLARYDQATPESVRKYVREQLTRNARVVVYGVPGEKVIDDVPRKTASEAEQKKQEMAGTMPDETWRAQPPKPGPVSKLSLPAPVKFQLPNGLNVYLLERHNLPVISVNLAVLAGSEANPKGRPGTASFTADMLDEGTEKRATLQLAQDVDKIGATLAATSTADYASVTMRSLTRNAEALFEILSDVALHPAFTPAEIERVRKERLTTLLQQRDNPTQLGIRTFYRELYGSGHPYGTIDLGTETSNKAITREDLAGFWKQRYVPGNSALVVAGALSEAELRSLATKYFGDWSGQGEKATPPEAPIAGARRVVIVDKPGAPQTYVRVGQVGVPRSSPDYVPLEVMNTTLGGLFSSRINLNLREQHGYTYGAFSAFVYRRGPGPFFAGSSIRTDVTAPAIGEIFKEIERMRNTDLTAEELRIAKDFISRSLPGLFETTLQAVNTVRDMYVYDLPLTYYSELPKAVDEVTAADVRRVAQKYLTPEHMIVVSVGDRSKIQPEIEKLGLGTVEVRDLDGNPVQTAQATPGN